MTTNLTEAQLLESIELTIFRMEKNKPYLLFSNDWDLLINNLSKKGYSVDHLIREEFVFTKNETNQLIFRDQVINRTNLNTFTLTLALALSLALALALTLALTLALVTGKLEGLPNANKTLTTKEYLCLD